MTVGHARTKGRPTGPRGLPTRAELAPEQSTRRRPSHFEQAEEYLTQRSSGTSSKSSRTSTPRSRASTPRAREAATPRGGATPRG